MSILRKEFISDDEYSVFWRISKDSMLLVYFFLDWLLKSDPLDSESGQRFYFYEICARIDIEFPLFGVRGGLNVYRSQSRRKRYRHGEELLNPNRKANCHN